MPALVRVRCYARTHNRLHAVLLGLGRLANRRLQLALVTRDLLLHHLDLLGALNHLNTHLLRDLQQGSVKAASRQRQGSNKAVSRRVEGGRGGGYPNCQDLVRSGRKRNNRRRVPPDGMDEVDHKQK